MTNNVKGPYRVDYVTIEKNEIHSMILSDEEKEEIVEAFKGIDTWTKCLEYLYNFYYSRHHLELVEKESLENIGKSSNMMGSLYINNHNDMWVGNITFKKIPEADGTANGLVRC